MLRALMLSAVLVAPVAVAQGMSPVKPTQPGFFKPSLDPSLTNAPAMTPELQAALVAAQAQETQPALPVQSGLPMPAMTPQAEATLRPETALTPVPNQPAAAAEFVEQQMDRSLRENEAARVPKRPVPAVVTPITQ